MHYSEKWIKVELRDVMVKGYKQLHINILGTI